MFNPIIPFDPAIDTPLGHRNLVLIYSVVWLAQLAYGAYTVRRWIKSGKGD
ncbi:hypothetical protein JAO29_18025 [Edaphobacter sp. HDX4]|uniref:hypothetical protein n=1 Tax=Edaphobacter sp. HDX4 TaxID=2794064 RepID=UPI002FE5944F